jgi:hypothetical protein
MLAFYAGCRNDGEPARMTRAQNTALRYCYRNGGKDCVIRAWACDGKG